MEKIERQNVEGGAAESASVSASPSLDEAVRALRRGEAALFPTDTVYGLGVSVEAAAGPDALYALKGRDRGKPIAWLVGSLADLDRYGCDVPAVARRAAAAFWPGPLTLIVRASDAVPPAFRSAAGTVGLRMPDDARALALIRAVGAPLATTSANPSGAPAPRCLAEVDEALAARAGAVVGEGGDEDARGAAYGAGAGSGASGRASTVLDCASAPPRILREGAIPLSAIEALPLEAGGEGRGRAMASADRSVAREGAGRIVREEAEYLSADGKTQIRALIWQLPEVASGAIPPRGVFQIVHGMAEHIARYDEFARYLAQRGFVACGEDHVGHGRSAAAADDLGHIPLKGGKDILIADVHELRRLVSARYAPQTPYFLFGHSMGSFIVRAYLARHAAGLAGAVICGTGQQPRALSAAGNALSRLVASARGARCRSALIDGLGAGAFGKRIEGARTPFDWLSTDPAVVDAFLDDPLCGAMFTVGGYAALTDLAGEVASSACAAKVPRDLPLLFIAGAEDPVGDRGRGVHAAANLMRRAGASCVEEIIYEGMRHEIVNEPGRARVLADVARWLDERLDAHSEKEAAS